MPTKTRLAARAIVAGLLQTALFFLLPHAGGAAEPLHQRIDAIVEAARLGPAAEICNDGAFVRRIHLDLVGVIPTAQQARQFIDDSAPDKRARLIDRLLADERFAHHMRIVFDAMWMERREEKHIKTEAWRAYLLDSFRENKPLNELAREILQADPDEGEMRAASRFFLDREVQPHLITRDVGRLMIGRDLQCAQCHDHPVIADYQQSEYYGIYAFINRSYLFNDKKKKEVIVAEKAEGDVSYESVFDKGTKYHSGPQLPGRPEIDEPQLAKDELYKVKPPKGGRGVPAFSRRKQLAERMTSGDYRPFNRNMANRLWAVMFGRGLVHPLDLHHDGNPPAHPELLNVLADELAAMKFDVRAFLREIALSRTYQRSSRLPEDLPLSPAAAEQVLSERNSPRQQHLDAAKQTRDKAEVDAARAAEIEDAEALLALADATDESAAGEAREKLLRRWSERFFVYGLQPLSPEQLAMSLYQATGDLPARLDAARQAEQAKAEKEAEKSGKDKPKADEKGKGSPKEPAATDPDAINKRAHRAVYSELQGVMNELVGVFLQGDGQPTEDYQGRAREALYLANSPRVQGLIGGRLARRLAAIEMPDEVAEELYLSVLSRRPQPRESDAVAEFIQGRDERQAAIEEMIWGLVSSTEFRFNH